MKRFTSQAIQVRRRLRQSLVIFTLVVWLFLTSMKGSYADSLLASNQTTPSFGPDQTILDLNQLTWKPLKAQDVPPGPELALLRGDTQDAESLEAVLRLPAHYTFPNHSHTSDEVYLWLKGDFTYIAADGTTIPLSGQSYISLPGSVPHALACGDTPCLFYLRYSRPFDLMVYPMPELKKLVRE